jgi:hypothetical protein
MGWRKIVKALPTDIDAGVYRGGSWDVGAGRFMEIQPLMGGYAEGPGDLEVYEDLSDEGPNGWNFVYQDAANVVRQVSEVEEMTRLPGPGEPGFTCIRQQNLMPQGILEKKLN